MEGIIKICPKEYGWKSADWIHLTVAGSCTCHNELSGPIQCGEFCDYIRTH